MTQQLVPATTITDRRSVMLMSIRDAGSREPLAQDIFDELAMDIVEGRLRPGDTLNSVDLARRFGTSRTPPREALAELERHGVVVVPPRRRPYVAYATLNQVRDVYEVRASLYALVSELIVDRCPADRIAELDAWQAALEDDVAREDSGSYFWHNVGFRFIEAGLPGNADLDRMIKSLGLRTLQFRHMSLSQPGQIQRSVADHRRLLRAYAERDKPTAVAITRALVMGGFRAIERFGLVPDEAITADLGTDSTPRTRRRWLMAPTPAPALKVGFNDRVPLLQLSVMTLQNIFAVTGMFLFPAVLGTSLHLPAATVAELYGATFIVTGVGTVINSAFGLRLPVVLGPWAPMLSGLVGAAKVAGLGAAFGSMFTASLIWIVLSIPYPGFSVVSYIGRLFRAPILYGGVVLILMTSLTNVTVVNWLGAPGSAGFGKASWIGGGVALLVTLAILVFVRGPVRSVAMLCGIAAGVIVYACLGPVSFAKVGRSPWLFDFRLFPFGFSVSPILVVLFFLLFMTSVSNSLALYNVTGEWSGAELRGRRMAWGILGQSVAAVVASVLGSFSSTTYPSNLAIVRASRVGSRWVTVTTGIVMIVGGSILKFDAIFVSIPSNVIAASAIILFGVLAMSAVESLSRVAWDELNFLVLGPPFMVAIGGLFVADSTLAHFPLIVREIISQPLLDGPVLLVVLHLLINHVVRPRLSLPEPRAEQVPVTSGAPGSPEVTA